MKAQDIKVLKEILITKKDTVIPEGWEVVKLPCKITENGIDFFKAVIGK